jgi:hypothetical protein
MSAEKMPESDISWRGGVPGVGEAALERVLESGLLDIVSLSRLAVGSKPLNHLVQGASCWKHLFEEAVRAAGKGYTRPGDSCQLDYMGLVGISWSGEKHLLSAFTDLGIAQAAGFKKAVKCLCVHTCEVCQASLFIHMICPI